jgi:hypothetical protein
MMMMATTARSSISVNPRLTDIFRFDALIVLPFRQENLTLHHSTIP